MPLMWSKYYKSLILMCRITNSSKTKKSLNSSRISKSTPLESVPTGDQLCWLRAAWGKRRKGDLVSFCENRGTCLWLVLSAGLLKILLWHQLYWLLYEGLLKILALGFISVSILRSNKEVAVLPNREDMVKDIQQFRIGRQMDVLAESWSLATITPKSLWTLAWITNRELLIL